MLMRIGPKSITGITYWEVRALDVALDEADDVGAVDELVGADVTTVSLTTMESRKKLLQLFSQSNTVRLIVCEPDTRPCTENSETFDFWNVGPDMDWSNE